MLPPAAAQQFSQVQLSQQPSAKQVPPGADSSAKHSSHARIFLCTVSFLPFLFHAAVFSGDGKNRPRFG